jgi:hypothetical protein
MTITLKNQLKKLPVARLEKINNRAKELIAQELTLRDLRRVLRVEPIFHYNHA